MQIQWFPGHMTKALRKMQDNLKLVDIVIETRDARIPESSRNPELDRITEYKPRVIVLNKADLADEDITKKWIQYFKEKDLKALALNALNRKELRPLIDTLDALYAEKMQRAVARGRLGRPMRVMVVGIPNTGKSSLINMMVGSRVAKSSDRPGVTKGVQWLKTKYNIELLDTPGVLWPKIEDKESQLVLAATGAIKDQVLDIEEVAYISFVRLCQMKSQNIKERYKLNDLSTDPYALFEQAARNRGCILSGGRIDMLRFSVLFLDELRGGKLGRLSLEEPDYGSKG